MKQFCLVLLVSIGLVPVAHAQSGDQDCPAIQPTIWAKAANEEFHYTAEVGDHCIAYRFRNDPSGVLTKIKLFDVKSNRHVIEKFSLAKCADSAQCETQTAALITFVGSSAPSEARLTYGGILGEAHTEAITIPLRSDLSPEPQSIQQRVWTRIVGWIGTPSGQALKIDIRLSTEFSPKDSAISYQLYSPNPDALPVVYMGSSTIQPYSTIWMDRLPGEKALALQKYGGFGNEPQVIDSKYVLEANVPAKAWGYTTDDITLRHWNESTGKSEEILNIPVLVIEPR